MNRFFSHRGITNRGLATIMMERVKAVPVSKDKKNLLWLAPIFCLLLTVASAAASEPANFEGQSHFTSLDKTRIHYMSYGTGQEALVLIHGWSCNLDYWRDQVPDFEKRSRVIAIDLPGHGQSDKPEISYTMDLFARAVDAVLRDAKVERAVLVGHSMGTPVARQFYRKYPQKTLAIVIVDGALRPFGDKAMMDRLVAGFRSPNYKEAGTQMFA